MAQGPGGPRAQSTPADGLTREEPSSQLAGVLADATQRLLAAKSVDDTMQVVVDLAPAVIPGVEAATITGCEGTRMVTSVGSDDRVAALDRLQIDIGEGPCLDAIKEHASFYSPDLASESRWPRFAAPAARLGLRSLLAHRLFVEPDTFGALNVYSSIADAFDGKTQHDAGLYASHASVALFHARYRAGEEREVAQLREAIGSRDVIGQAKGILMERQQISDEEAFSILVKRSQTENRKLRLVASDVVEGHLAAIAGGTGG